MNWGTKITLGLLLFMGFIVALGAKMIAARVDLVSPDYYGKSVKYDEKYNEVNNYDSLDKKPDFMFTENRHAILMPMNAAGTITLYRKNDSDRDFSIDFDVPANDTIIIPSEKMEKGEWRIMLRWKSENKNYYTEKNISI